MAKIKQDYGKLHVSLVCFVANLIAGKLYEEYTERTVLLFGQGNCKHCLHIKYILL